MIRTATAPSSPGMRARMIQRSIMTRTVPARDALCCAAMPDDVDDLILKMQHLEAAAKAERTAHAREGWASNLKTRAQQMAAESQAEVSSAEHDEAEGQSRMERARTPGLPSLEAADLLISG